MQFLSSRRPSRESKQSTLHIRLSQNRAVNNVKARVLQKHEIEEALTSAARTLKTTPLTGEPSLKTQLPKDFSDNPLSNIEVQKNVNGTTKATTHLPTDVAIRMPEFDTRKSLPAEFSPKLTASQDNSFGAMALGTKAAATLDRPLASRAGIDNPETNDQGAVADRFCGAGKSRPKATTTQTQDKTNPKTVERSMAVKSR